MKTTRTTRHVILQLGFVTLLAAALACGGSAKSSEKEPVEKPTEVPLAASTEPPIEPTLTPIPAVTADQAGTAQSEYDTVFPLPDDVQGFVGSGGESMINFQTDLTLEEVVDFYRDAFATRGLTEREILTAIEEATFSMVFDGSPNGKAIVIQGVDLGGSMNVNIRFEDV